MARVLVGRAAAGWSPSPVYAGTVAAWSMARIERDVLLTTQPNARMLAQAAEGGLRATPAQTIE
jgi:hypothetical protein